MRVLSERPPILATRPLFNTRNRSSLSPTAKARLHSSRNAGVTTSRKPICRTDSVHMAARPLQTLVVSRKLQSRPLLPLRFAIFAARRPQEIAA